MKKLRMLILIVPVVLILLNCNTKKGTLEKTPVKQVSYKTDIAPILSTSCTPCHFPPDGRKKPYENYEHVKADIASIIERVKLPHDDPRFMPFKQKKPPLNDSLIAVLEKWQQQNMPE
jgi:hypothetical protein